MVAQWIFANCKFVNLFSDDEWTHNAAKVVCRFLGYNETYARATTNSAFGRVEDNYIFDDVSCRGTENFLEDCPHKTKDNCDAGEGAGVICYGMFLYFHRSLINYVILLLF